MSICEAAEDRLIQYGRFRRRPVTIRDGMSSPFGRLHDLGGYPPGFTAKMDSEQDAAMIQLVTTQQSELFEVIQAKEVHEAIADMRHDAWRVLVDVTWVDIPHGKEDLPSRAAAEKMGLSLSAYRDMRLRVLGYMEARLYSPAPTFIVESDAVQEQAA